MNLSHILLLLLCCSGWQKYSNLSCLFSSTQTDDLNLRVMSVMSDLHPVKHADPHRQPQRACTVKTERDTTLVQYYIYFLQWILVAIQEVLRIWGGRGKEECSYRKFLSLFISVISWLYDDLVAQNYSNIENMNTSLCTNYRKHLSLYEDLIKE